MLAGRLNRGDCALSMTDSSMSAGWLRKPNFWEFIRENVDPVRSRVRIDIARTPPSSCWELYNCLDRYRTYVRTYVRTFEYAQKIAPSCRDLDNFANRLRDKINEAFYCNQILRGSPERPSGDLVRTTLLTTGREVTDGHSHFPTRFAKLRYRSIVHLLAISIAIVHLLAISIAIVHLLARRTTTERDLASTIRLY